jgi:hypothetical protein
MCAKEQGTDMNNKKLSSMDRRAVLPRWVKLFAIAATLVSLLFLSMMLANMASMGIMSGMGNMHGMSGMGSSPSRSLPLWTLVSGFVTLVVVLLGFLALLAGVGGRRRMFDRQASLPGKVLPPLWRKLILTVHIMASVGWIGAIVGFLALAVAGFSSPNALLVRGAFLAMDVTAGFVLIPFSLASLLTGLTLSLSTKWGLLWHYWVLAKLLINVLASMILLMYVQSLSSLAAMVATSTVSGGALLSSSDSLPHSIVALLALLIATLLSVYKPRGMTSYGWRKQAEQRQGSAQEREDSQAQAVVTN